MSLSDVSFFNFFFILVFFLLLLFFSDKSLKKIILSFLVFHIYIHLFPSLFYVFFINFMSYFHYCILACYSYNHSYFYLSPSGGFVSYGTSAWRRALKRASARERPLQLKLSVPRLSRQPSKQCLTSRYVQVVLLNCVSSIMNNYTVFFSHQKDPILFLLNLP